MTKKLLPFLLLSAGFCINCTKNITKDSPAFNSSTTDIIASSPNIILIVADDIGYEVPGYAGGQSYSTPNIDRLSRNGMQFTQCHTAPLCTPSRVMLLTGKYNFRNYTDWGILDTTQYTLANLLKNAGYATCVAGKWQLDGGDASLKKAGFDYYRIFSPFTPATVAEENAENWYRYKNPHLYERGAFVKDSLTLGKYAEDLFGDYINKFIDSNRNKPFFVYYPMSLCHYPFVPTPDDADYSTWTPESHISDTQYFTSMVKYMDKKIGQLLNSIVKKGMAANTVIMFISDNGTPPQIISLFNGATIRGGKGTTTQYGTHVPFLAAWPGHIIPGSINHNIINLPDFMPVFSDIAASSIKFLDNNDTDGVSFYNSLFSPADTVRSWGFCHSQPYETSVLRRWAQNEQYKLYDSVNNNKFFNILTDTLEQTPITNRTITIEEKNIKARLQLVLNEMHN